MLEGLVELLAAVISLAAINQGVAAAQSMMLSNSKGACSCQITTLLPLYTMETRRVQLCMQQKLHNLEIAHWCRAISRLHTGAVQSRDCVNPVRNLEIA